MSTQTAGEKQRFESFAVTRLNDVGQAYPSLGGKKTGRAWRPASGMTTRGKKNPPVRRVLMFKLLGLDLPEKLASYPFGVPVRLRLPLGDAGRRCALGEEGAEFSLRVVPYGSLWNPRLRWAQAILRRRRCAWRKVDFSDPEVKEF